MSRVVSVYTNILKTDGQQIIIAPDYQWKQLTSVQKRNE